MFLKPNTTFRWVFHTFDSTGTLADADSTPTVSITVDGVSDDWSESVSKLSTGTYLISGTVPNDLAAGEWAVVSVSAEVDGLSATKTWNFLIDTKRVSDLLDVSAEDVATELGFDDIDSTETETITASNALEIIFAFLAGNATYDSDTNTWTVYGRDGTTSLLTIQPSETTPGTRTNSALPS